MLEIADSLLFGRQSQIYYVYLNDAKPFCKGNNNCKHHLFGHNKFREDKGKGKSRPIRGNECPEVE
jgi:hypothetical protein